MTNLKKNVKNYQNNIIHIAVNKKIIREVLWRSTVFETAQLFEIRKQKDKLFTEMLEQVHNYKIQVTKELSIFNQRVQKLNEELAQVNNQIYEKHVSGKQETTNLSQKRMILKSMFKNENILEQNMIKQRKVLLNELNKMSQIIENCLSVVSAFGINIEEVLPDNFTSEKDEFILLTKIIPTNVAKSPAVVVELKNKVHSTPQLQIPQDQLQVPQDLDKVNKQKEDGQVEDDQVEDGQVEDDQVEDGQVEDDQVEDEEIKNQQQVVGATNLDIKNEDLSLSPGRSTMSLKFHKHKDRLETLSLDEKKLKQKSESKQTDV